VVPIAAGASAQRLVVGLYGICLCACRFNATSNFEAPHRAFRITSIRLPKADTAPGPAYANSHSRRQSRWRTSRSNWWS